MFPSKLGQSSMFHVVYVVHALALLRFSVKLARRVAFFPRSLFDICESKVGLKVDVASECYVAIILCSVKTADICGSCLITVAIF